MKLNIIAKNFEVSDYLEEIVTKKFEKLDRFFDKDITAEIKVSAQAGIQKMEATINANGMIFRAEEYSADIYSTIESVTGKLEKQIVKFKDKIVTKHQGGGINFAAIEEDDIEVKPAEVEIVKTKKFTVKPMDPVEAALQMQLLDHNFFVFRDAETDDICVVYKRKDGKIGLIDPYFD